MARKRQRTTDVQSAPGRPTEAAAPAIAAPAPATRYALPALIILAGILAYSTSFAGDFIFDDARYVADYEHIDQLWPPWPHLATRRPVVQITLAINYAISGFNTWSYHLVNLIIHLLAGLTLFGLIRRTLLLPRHAPRFTTTAPYLAAAVAGLWVVHPLNTQSVVYIVQRGEALMGLFYLFTIYALLRGSTARTGTAWYIVAILTCALGMATKGVMVTAPVVAVIYDRIFLANSWSILLRKRGWLHAALFATIGVLALVGVAKGILAPDYPQFATVGFGYQGATPFHYLQTQAGVILHYIRLAFLPYPLILDYNWPTADQPIEWLLPGLIILILLAATAFALWRKPALGFVGIWFFFILAPTSSVVPIKDAAFEHRMYLSLAAILLVVVLGAHKLLRRLLTPHQRTRAAIILIALAGASLATGTALRNLDYHSPLRMWGQIVRHRPENARAHNNLGLALENEGQLDAARQHYRRAIEINPHLQGPHYNLANLLRQEEGNLHVAIEHFRTAIRLDPKFVQAYTNLGEALKAIGQTEQAIEAYEHALHLDPDRPLAHFNLGNALLKLKRYEKAVEHFRAAIASDPTYVKPHVNLAYTLNLLGRTDEAIELYRQAVELDPQMFNAYLNLALLLDRQERYAEALPHYQTAARLRPDHVTVHVRLGLLLERLGRPREALDVFQSAARANPDNTQIAGHLRRLQQQLNN